MIWAGGLQVQRCVIEAESSDTCVELGLPDFWSVPVARCAPAGWAVQLALEEKSVPRVDRWQAMDGSLSRREHLDAVVCGEDGVTLKIGSAEFRGLRPVLEEIDRRWPFPVLVPPRYCATIHGQMAASVRLHELVAEWLDSCAAREAQANDLRLPASVQSELGRLSRCVSAGGFVAGDWFSVADLLVYPWLATLLHSGVTFTEACTPLGAYCRRMRARASVIRTWPEPWTAAG